MGNIMKFKALTTFLHDELGSIKKGDTVEANKVQAVTPLALGYFEEFKGSKAKDEPTEEELQDLTESVIEGKPGKGKAK